MSDNNFNYSFDSKIAYGSVNVTPNSSPSRHPIRLNEDSNGLIRPVTPAGGRSQNQQVPPVNIEQVQRFASIGIGLSTLLLENLLSHPCIVLRRQCQVNKVAAKYHLSPFTIIPVTGKLIGRQGFGTLWKGATSVFIVHGLAIAAETAVSDLTNFPKEVYIYSQIKHLAQHLALKCITFTFVTPFLCSSLVETVQSDIASEKPGIADCLKEGLFRIVQWGKPRTSRLQPIWILLGPTVIHSVASYTISAVVHSVAAWYLRLRLLRKRGITDRMKENISQTDRLLIEVMSSFVGNLVADILLYPLETVIHRLYLQGTRAIIDDLDTGLAVTPIVTRYDGPIDCFQTIVVEEGASGLYRGFGALVLQYCLQGLILKGTKMILDNVRNLASGQCSYAKNNANQEA